jgi:hypothetical protein
MKAPVVLRLFFGFILLASGLQGKAQRIDSLLNIMSTQFSEEKIYIHYDKEFYVTGETIWFKAYLYADGKPGAASKNFHVQFLNSNGQIVSEKKYPVVGSVVKGSIAIQDSLTQGNYYIRAYTPAMLNFDESFIYKKNIFVFKPGSSLPVKSQQTVSIKFFPESGHLVDGILTVVGFKAVDQLGTPVNVNGIIKTEDGTTIASFYSFHDGIGRVQFKPQAGKKYIAEVETEAGKRTYTLPEVNESGINLKVQDEKTGKKFLLSRSTKDKELYENLLIVAEINNHVVYENEVAFEDYPAVIGHLITDSLPSGILHFTVFDKNLMPLAERLSFIDNGEYKGIAELKISKFSSEKRTENIVVINFPESIQRSCSVAVIDMPASGVGNTENIYSRLLLTSDLKGYIHNPAWYFTGQNDSSRLALENLMLTHGWSRFNWTKMLSGEFPVKKYTDQSLITISGRLITIPKNEPVSNGKLNIYLEAEDSSSQNYDVPVDASGRFILDSLVFWGKGKIFYVYTDKQNKVKSVSIILDSNLLVHDVSTTPSATQEMAGLKNYDSKSYKEEINNRYKEVRNQLDEVKELENVDIKVNARKKPIDIVNEKYTSGVFRSPGKVDIDNINEPATDKSMNVVDYIKNRIQQITIQGGRFVNRKNFSLMSGQNWAIGVFLNEVPTDISQLRVLRTDDVALVKFYEAGFVGVGSTFPGGAIAVYTKERFVEVKPDKLEFIEFKGYSIVKEFYNPDYNVPNAKHAVADNRTTLYWNPDVFTDSETHAVKLNFFNNDFSKKFKIVLEGFDASGKLLHLEKIIGN